MYVAIRNGFIPQSFKYVLYSEISYKISQVSLWMRVLRVVFAHCGSCLLSWWLLGVSGFTVFSRLLPLLCFYGMCLCIKKGGFWSIAPTLRRLKSLSSGRKASAAPPLRIVVMVITLMAAEQNLSRGSKKKVLQLRCSLALKSSSTKSA